MAKTNPRTAAANRRKISVRKKIAGTAERPRLCVRRTLKHIFAQIIDDDAGKTLASASSVKLKVNGSNVAGAKQVGAALAESAKAASVTQVCFDRGAALYHGRVKALAEAAREGGLQF